MTVTRTKQSPFRSLPVLIALLFNIIAAPALPVMVAAAVGTNIDQCANGQPEGPRLACAGSQWQNGNLNESNSQYAEDDSVAFRARATGLTASTTYQIDIQYDNTENYTHAYDYLTSWDRTESGDPCTSPFSCGTAGAPGAIPSDPTLVTAGVPQDAGVISVWGADITSIVYSPDSPTTAEGQHLQTTVRVTFSTLADSTSAVFAWGGHIASELDWGTGNGASDQPGSPYHMRLQGVFNADRSDELTGQASQDRSLKASSVLLPPPVATQVSASSISLGQSVTDTATVTERGGRGAPTGSILFFVCGPMDPAAGCPTDGTQVGTAVTLVPDGSNGNGDADEFSTATSAPFTPTVAGFYCFRAEYTPDDASDDDYTAASHTDSTLECFNTNAPSLVIEKDPDEGEAGNEIDAGDYAVFTITVTNNGAGTATNVDIDDNLPEGPGATNTGLVWSEVAGSENPDALGDCAVASNNLHCDIPSLGAGQSFSVQVRALTDAGDCGQLDNTAFADADNHAQISNPGEIDVNCGDIRVEKEPDQGDLGSTVTAGDDATFVITVHNDGVGEARGVTLFDDLPDTTNGWTIVTGLANTTFTGCAITNPAADDPDLGQVLNCGPDDIAAAGSLKVTVTTETDPDDCDLTNTAVLFNSADAESSNDGSDSDTGQITINCPEIRVEKEPDQGDLGSTVTAGDDATFTITVHNDGVGEARGVTLFDDLPDTTNGWTIVTGLANTTFTGCAITNPAADDPDLGQVLNCGPDDIAAAGSLKVTVTTETDPGDCDLETSAVLFNSADADSSNDGSDTDTGQITINCPEIRVEKEPDQGDLGSTVTAGDNATFTITVHNDGVGEARDVTLYDDLPDTTNGWTIVAAQTTFTGCAITNPASDSPDLGQVLNCGPDDIAAAGSLKVTVTTLTDPDDCGLETSAVLFNSADADSSNDGSDTDTGRITILCPDVSVEKTATDPVISSTQEASFTIVVDGGPIGTTGDVTLTDVLPAGFSWTVGGADIGDCSSDSFVTSLTAGDVVAGGLTIECNFGPLDADETRTITLTTTTAEDDCDLRIENTATVATDGDADLGDNESTASVTVECPELSAEKLADDDLVSAGQDIGFTISIENADESNTGTAFNVTIVDLLPDGEGIDWEIAADSLDDGACSIDGSPPAETLECDFGDLGPGDAVSVHVVSDTTLASCETYRNVATVDADNHVELLPEDSLTVECPNYNVAKVARVGTIDAGETAIFDIVVWNAGEGTAFDVTLIDTLPGDLAWSEDSEDCSISEGVLTCDFGDLAAGSSQEEPGASVTLSALTDRTDCGELDNTAIVDANPGEPVQSSDSITVKCPLVSIVKVNNTTASVLPGTNVTFTLTVTVSDGPAEDVTVVDTLPTGYNAPTVISDGGTFNATTRKITWELGDLADGPHSVTYQAAVSAGVANGTQLVNVAIVFSSNSQCPNATSLAPACDDDSTVTVRVPTLVIDKAANVELITKTLDPQGNVISIVPPSVTWTLTYTLTNGPVTNAVITDPIPAGLTYVNGSASNGGVYNAGTKTLTWTFPVLSASGFVTFQTTVNQDAPAGVILNVATIDSEETGPDEGQDSIRIVEDQQLGGTSSAQPSLPSTALNQPSSGGSMAALLFGMILIAALGGLAYVNVVAVRRRR